MCSVLCFTVVKQKKKKQSIVSSIGFEKWCWRKMEIII